MKLFIRIADVEEEYHYLSVVDGAVGLEVRGGGVLVRVGVIVVVVVVGDGVWVSGIGQVG